MAKRAKRASKKARSANVVKPAHVPPRDYRRPSHAGKLIVGCFLLGTGLGMIYGRTATGALIGLGIGLIASDIIRRL